MLLAIVESIETVYSSASTRSSCLGAAMFGEAINEDWDLFPLLPLPCLFFGPSVMKYPVRMHLKQQWRSHEKHQSGFYHTWHRQDAYYPPKHYPVNIHV